MFRMKKLTVLAAMAALSIASGCESSSDDSADGTATVTGSYEGLWTGKVCGRGLTFEMSQNGTALSGTYTFTDPTFSGTFSGTVSSETPPATARLVCDGHDWWYEITFASYNSLSGGFYKAEKGGLVCNVSATK